MTLRLESWYVPAAEGGAGTMRLRLVNAGPDELAAGFRLVLTSVVQLDPLPPATLIERTSGCHTIAPGDGSGLAPGAVWVVEAACGHRPRHANDGPASAYVVGADGAVRPARTGVPGRIAVAGEARPGLHLATPGDDAAAAWAAAAEREGRLFPGVRPVLTDRGEVAVTVEVDASLPGDAHRLAPDGERGWRVAAGSADGLAAALTALARSEGSLPGAVVRRPACEWRGLHIDLARQFMPAGDVAWLVDVAAWHGLNRLHLHLTDDEGWRLPVEGYPQLTDSGAFRGHGLALPALLGSGPDPYGGAYTAADIRAWGGRAATSGVALVPEVDVPGHSAAALAAVPELRDPGDTTGARSVQQFVDNALNPGVAATWPFLEAVVGSMADLFDSPWLHVGGDEVAAGAWSGSPAAARWAAERGIAGTTAVAASFLRAIVGLVHGAGRRVGAWQEAAELGAMEPGDGYVVGWKSDADCRRLAAAGFAVVAAPAPHCYLDMAPDDDWWTPGASWAGAAGLDAIRAFDPTQGWSPAERARLLGLQACLWTEHAPDRPALERLLLPRLGAIADLTWTTRPAAT